LVFNCVPCIHIIYLYFLIIVFFFIWFNNHYKKIDVLRLVKLHFATVETVAICHLRHFTNSRGFVCRKSTLRLFWKQSLQLSQLLLQQLWTVLKCFLRA
jgi:hypothetical protein